MTYSFQALIVTSCIVATLTILLLFSPFAYNETKVATVEINEVPLKNIHEQLKTGENYGTNQDSNDLARSVNSSLMESIDRSIGDYFLPVEGKNKTRFRSPFTGETARQLYYKQLDTLEWEITDFHFINGQITSVETRFLIFSGKDVKVKKAIFTNMFEFENEQTYEPALIILRMPPIDGSASWDIIKAGDTYHYSSSWASMKIGGERLIKVESNLQGKTLKTIEYYAIGYGLWQTDFKSSEGSVNIIEELDAILYEDF